MKQHERGERGTERKKKVSKTTSEGYRHKIPKSCPIRQQHKGENEAQKRAPQVEIFNGCTSREKKKKEKKNRQKVVEPKNTKTQKNPN